MEEQKENPTEQQEWEERFDVLFLKKYPNQNETFDRWLRGIEPYEVKDFFRATLQKEKEKSRVEVIKKVEGWVADYFDTENDIYVFTKSEFVYFLTSLKKK
ncbi:MAG: hypothetical protein WCT51_04890 [Candidatus Shapirobacteria bacterium]|jgi:retron-type reverse transcriptase